MQKSYQVIAAKNAVPIKAWTIDVPFEAAAREQLQNIATLPFIHKWVAAMPDVHQGIGATVGSVIPCDKAIIPAAVGVDIGCGMVAVQTDLDAKDLPDNLKPLRSAIEKAVPHGRTNQGGRNDRGAWTNPPPSSASAWNELQPGYQKIIAGHKALDRGATISQLGTLGTGNHFIEVCLDESNAVWFMLHSGSRGPGNRIGTHFIELAKREMERWSIHLPDQDLAYLPEGSEYFSDYVHAVSWAQNYAQINRQLMMNAVITAVKRSAIVKEFSATQNAINCHHNYVSREHHYGKDVFVTRKGAVRAAKGELGIIPGSMGARSFIVRGLGNPESFNSCSHGAGRVMSRTEAKRRITAADHALATHGVECRKDAGVLDESPAAYKSIDAVMHAQRDLVQIVHTLKQVVCVKG